MFFKNLILFFILFTSISNAITVTSIHHGNWEDPSTWNTGLVPTNQDSIIINHYVVIHLNKTISAPTVLFISSTGTICGDYLLETLCGAKFINYGFMFLNQIKTRLGSNYNTIKCKVSMIIYGCSPSTAGFSSFPPNGNVTIWPPVLCQTIDTNWEGGTSIGVVELDNNKLSVYPNPIQNESLKIKTHSLTRLKLTDVCGKEITQSVFENSTELDMKELSTGVYFLKIEFNGRTEIKKIIKVN